MNNYDVVLLGETMLRLTPPNGQRIAQTKQFDIEIGGTESNTAVGLARLGLQVAWLSRLPNSPLGEFVAQNIRRYGVDTQHVVWADESRLGLYFWEDAAAPRPNLVIYDRKHSAISQMVPQELPRDLFANGRSQHLHLTGITPALSNNAAATAQHAAELAAAAGWRVSFDLNFRSKLWSAEEARAGCEPFMQLAELLITPIRDAQTIYALDEALSPEDVLNYLGEQYPHKMIVITLGADGALGLDENGRIQHQPIIPTNGTDRLGSGDAFAAGLLYGLYFDSASSSLANGLRWGTAMAAMKRTITGDVPLVDKTAVAQLVSADQSPKDVR